ncbi:unnamed protein product [Effrenium voratum]|uniref:Feruloyl esterase n=1 Tax=Effrenium voratum TaxID=2562239 RepID=A0AA36IIX7_9DINO|nr:unnamed protein product [Effrenium voratum]
MAFFPLAALATLVSCRGEHVDVDLEDLSMSLLQQKHRVGDCSGGYGPGQHIVQLPEIQRQFLFIVPRDHAPLAKIPAMMFFHGMYQSPFFSLRLLGLPDQLERYGWFGILPWGIPENETTSMGGQRQCCAQLCGDDLNCCLESRFVMYQDEGACGFPPEKNDLNLRFVDAIFEWMARETCIDTSKVFAGGFSYGGHFAQVLACHRSHLFQLLAPNASPDFPSEFSCEGARHRLLMFFRFAVRPWLAACGSGLPSSSQCAMCSSLQADILHQLLTPRAARCAPRVWGCSLQSRAVALPSSTAVSRPR